MPRKRFPIEQKFWARVVKSDGCWLWSGSVDCDGYGLLHDRFDTHRAHRFSYYLANGCIPIPKEAFVCHTCDNRRCVNPTHLWLGDNAANTADRNEKGRQFLNRPKGREVALAKLDETGVLDLRRKFAGGVKIVSLAKEYGLDWKTVESCVKGKTWRHVRGAT